MSNQIYFELNGESKKATIREDVTLAELIQAIADGVDLCHDTDGMFHPELVDFAIEYENLATLTDLEITDIEDAYRYVRAIDGVPSVDADFIADGIRAQVEYDQKMLAATLAASGADNVAKQLEGIVSAVNGLLTSLAAGIDRLADAVPQDGIDINGLMKSLSSADLSDGAIVNKILDYQEAKKKATPKKKVAEKVAVKK